MVSRLFLWKEKSSRSLPSCWSHSPRDLFILMLLHSKSCLCSFSLQKQSPELQSHCPANPTSWHKDLGIRQEWDFWLVQGIHLFHTQLSSGIPWPWDDQLVRISLRIYMYWSEIDLRLGWEMVYSVRDNSVFMGQG